MGTAPISPDTRVETAAVGRFAHVEPVLDKGWRGHKPYAIEVERLQALAL